MIEVLKKSSYKVGLWKNGKGLTRQIAIFPINSSVEENTFLWRISSAEVNRSDLFSHFPKCERKLVVWSGEGLLFNGTPILPDSPTVFSGEEAIQCDLLGSTPVVDLGIIYKKELIIASLLVFHLRLPTSIKLSTGTHFIFLANGEECSFNDKKIKNGDCIKLELLDNEEFSISTQSHSELTIYQISISDR